ncbi:sn-glycerol-3-phosphate ABC transporter ATP-binding protein UgpC [Candidatus Sumerlaeota bacterium]|nr:sn-glycerol-3-phosphate ABC transporter ATP-binding protein UgpC [Candidatus Sumerlaeota bacterium]
MARVQLKNIWKVFPGDVIAVNDVTLDIQDKEFLVLVGPSGCGKSTTLRMVAGLEEISKGEIFIGDRLVNDVAPKDRNIAMVFQNYALYPHMTVYNNMAFGLKLAKLPKREIDARVREAAQILGIEMLLDRKPKALSGGQRQRVAVGRAIVRQPAVFLFDEPLSNLDAKLRVQMRTEISKLHSRLQATMIYVTHDQVEAMTMGDRIVVMKDGLIQQVADPITLYDNPTNKFVAGFIGSPPMNFMDGTIEGNGSGPVFQEGSVSLPLPPKFKEGLAPFKGRKVTFGIRPEDIYDTTENLEGHIKIDAKVEVIEPMGAEIYLYVTTGTSPFIARCEPHTTAKVDETKTLTLDLNKAHFFDPETENVII